MLRNRCFDLLIVLTLGTIMALTAREAIATASVVSQANPAHAIPRSACAILSPRMFIHSDYVSERGMWVTYTVQGSAGVDDGLLGLLSTYPTCSR